MCRATRPYRTVVGTLLIVMLLLAAGCGAPLAGSGPAPTTTQAPRIAMVLIGTSADGGWNTAGAEGLRQLRDQLGAEIDYTEVEGHADWEENPPEDWIAALKKYAEQDYDLIFAHGRRWDAVVPIVAPQYPDIPFVVTGGTVSGPNYASTTIRNEETGYLLGVLAGLLTKTNVIGTIAGADIRPHLSTVEAFKMGAESVNAEVEFVEVLLNEQTSDPPDANAERGAQITEELVAGNADMIFIRSSTAHVGIIKTAEKHGVKILNYAKDLTNVAPTTVIANGIQEVPVLMRYTADLVLSGKFEGKNYIMGLTEGAVRLSPFREDLVPPDVQSRVQQTRQELIAGTIKVEVER